MKNRITRIVSTMIMAFVMVLFVSANTVGEGKDKKTKSEVKKEQVQTKCSATCNHATACTKGAACDPAKCAEKGCDHKSGTCDPKTCKGHDGKVCKEGKPCDHSACTGTCKGKAK